MEIFRTLVPVIPSQQKITYQSNIMLIGSCFSEYIGNKLIDFKFKTINNPFGIVYNPFSIKRILERLLENKPYSQQDLFNYEGIWYSFDHHSRFSGRDLELCLQNINSQLLISAEFLKNTNFLFLTFGTAMVYTLVKNNNVVSNCHKLPAKQFNHNRIKVETIVEEYNMLLQQLLSYNQKIQIVFTVSPIRHWKDGAHENQLSKAILLIAIDELCKLYKNTFYFPSYEILMDDLRDYRFYEEDMLHPNKIGVNYIWTKFKECFIGQETISIMKEVEKVMQAKNHRPFNPETDQYMDFLKQNINKLRLLKDQYGINFEDEEKFFSSGIK